MRALRDVVNRRESVRVSRMFALHQQAQKPVLFHTVASKRPRRNEPRDKPQPSLLVPQTRPDQTRPDTNKQRPTCRSTLRLHPSTPPTTPPTTPSPKRPTNQPSSLSRNPPPNPLRPHPNLRTQIQRPPQSLHLLRHRCRFPSHCRRASSRRRNVLLRNHNLGVLQHGDRDDERGFRSHGGGREEG